MSSKQLWLADYEQSTAKKRKKLLAEMEKVVHWQALVDFIRPDYLKTSSKRARPSHPLGTMLRIHLMQQWDSLSDPAMEDALIELPTMRCFAGIELISEKIPYEATNLSIQHLLEKNNLRK